MSSKAKSRGGVKSRGSDSDSDGGSPRASSRSKKPSRRNDDDDDDDESGSEEEGSGSDASSSDGSEAASPRRSASKGGGGASSSSRKKKAGLGVIDSHAIKSSINPFQGTVSRGVQNPLGKRKEIARYRRWMAASQRSSLLTIDDLPADAAPKMTAGNKPLAYSLTLHKVEQWPLPPALSKRVEESGGAIKIKYSLSLSFFHSTSKRFFGSTWMGYQHTDKSLRKESGGSASSGSQTMTLLANELVFWQSRIFDDRCFCVIELVATEVDNHSKVVLGQYGCGWAMFQPFGDSTLKDVSYDQTEEEGYLPLKVYQGTPRKLRFLTKADYYRLDEIVVPGCKIRYKLALHDKLAKICRDRNLFKENAIIGAGDIVAGLATEKLKLPDDRGTAKGAILGGTANGSKKNWQIVPTIKPALSPTFNIEIRDLQITIEDRDSFERQMLDDLSDRIPNEDVFKQETNMFGMKRLTKQKTTTDSTTARAKIMWRKLKVGVHNSRALLGFDWIEIDLEESDIREAEDDLILPDSVSKIKLQHFAQHPMSAIVVLLEYIVRPATTVVLNHAEQARKGKSSTAEYFHIVIGCQAYVPYDGKRWRLRNVPKEGGKKSPGQVVVPMLSDHRTRVFSNDHVYNPTPLNRTNEDNDCSKMLKFELKVFDKKGQEMEDETPAQDEDESEEEQLPAEESEGELSEAESEVSERSAVSSRLDSESASESETSSSSEESEEESEEETPKKPKKKKEKKVKKPKKKKEKKKKEKFEDEGSDLESSIVSGDSFNNFLVLRTGVSGGRRSHGTFKPKKSKKDKYRYSADDVALASIREEEWEGWRSGIHVPRDKRGATGAALTAPIHFNGDLAHRESAYTRTGDYEPTAMAVNGNVPLSSEMTRAAKTRLGRNGFFEKVIEGFADVTTADDLSSNYSIDKELDDGKLRHEITMQFAAFSAPEKRAPVPNSVYFTFQFYDKEPTRTERLVLRTTSSSDENDNTISRVLCKEKAGKGTNEYSPSKTLKFTIDLSMVGMSEARNFVSYLKTKTLYIDVWDGDALMHIGTIGIPMRKLMRQGKSNSKIARTYDVVSPRGLCEDGGALGVRPGALGGGPVVGHVQMLLANFGESGKGGTTVGAGIESEVQVESTGKVAADLNWRSNALSSSMGALVRPVTPGRAKHKVRARPLSETNKDLQKMVKSFGVDGGDLGASATGRAGRRGGDDMDTISYEELMKLCTRFRAPQKGRIDYRTSGLMELLDVPDVGRLEKRLVRLLTLAEDRGTSLEEAFHFLDSENDKEITASELEEGLKRLKAFEGMRRDEIALLVSRFPRNKSDMISLVEFIRFVRERQPKSEEEGKLRRILKKAEAMGKSVEDIFGFFDKDGTGSITLAEFRDGLSQLGPFSKLSSKEFKTLAKRFDNDGDGKVSLFEFMIFMGKKYDPVDSAKKKLKAILLKAEEMGTSMQKAFAHFDREGTGEIDLADFHEGLTSLGVFADLTEGQVSEVLKEFDRHNSGIVSLTDFMRFMGKDYVADVESKLRKILAKAISMGTTIQDCFSHFDTDKDGKVNAADMQTGMKSLGQFEQVGANEVQELIRRFDDDGDGYINEAEFIAAFGSAPASRPKKPAPPSEVEKKVVELFMKAERRGTTVAQLFAAIGGEKSVMKYKVFGDALKSLGSGFESLTSVEITQLCEGFDPDKTGSISLENFKNLIHSKEKIISAFKAEDEKTEEDEAAAAESTICALYGMCMHFSGGQQLSDYSSGKDSMSFTAWKRALSDMLAEKDFLRPMDAELNGKACQDILRGAFVDPNTTRDGDISVRMFNAWYQGKIKGAKNLDAQNKAIVGMLARLCIANSLDLGENNEIAFEDGMRLIGDKHADVRLRGKGVSKLYATFAGSISFAGSVSSATLIKTLTKLLLECRVRATEGEVKSLVKRFELNKSSTEVDVSAFFEWLCKGARAGEEGKKEKEDEEGSEGDAHENKENDDDEASPYNFSSDPEIRDIEKKLRKAARKAINAGLTDLNALFAGYDPENSGTVVRSDFIQILMELGLSLLDSGEAALNAAARDGFNDVTRKRQMAALAAHKGGTGQRAAKLREKKPQLFAQSLDDRGDAFNDEREALNLIKWYRDGQKKTIVRDLLTQSLTTKYTLHPRFGHTLFFEYELKNPFGTEERFMIQFEDKELRVVTNSDEWMYLRRRVVPAVGGVGEWPMEHDMIDGDSKSGFQITLQARETVAIPFTLLSIDPTLRDGEAGSRQIAVSFVSASHGHTTAVMELDIKPRAMVVDRSFRFFQAEGEILKRTIQLLSHREVSLDEHDYESNGEGHKYVHCVELSSNRVVVDWRGSAQPGAPQEVMIKYRCGKFPSLGEFYIIIYDDHFQGIVHECWHVVIQSRLRLDVNAAVGQATPSDLVVQGDKFTRRVMMYSSSPAETTFGPDRAFQLTPGAFNRASVRFRMRSAGSHKVHLHMVDLDTKELVCAWLVNVNSNLPVITKIYDVQLPIGCGTSKKLSFTNQWDKARKYNLLSSDESVMKPRQEQVDIDPRAVGYMRLYFNPIEAVGTHEVILFVNDERDQNEEAFLLKLHVSE